MMIKIKMVRLAFAFAVVCSVFAASVAAQNWKPEQNVEISVGTGPGGGADRTARFIQRLIQEKKLMPQAVTVVLRFVSQPSDACELQSA